MRVASLVPSATEMLFALRDVAAPGDELEVVAVTHECDYPPEAASLPHLTSTVIPPGLDAAGIDAEVKRVTGEGLPLYELDEEALRAAAPDFIVTQALCAVCAVSYEDVATVAERLPGPPPLVSQDPENLADVLDDVTRLGEALGMTASASALRADLEGRLASVRAAVSERGRPRVLALEWLDPAFIGGHWVPEMIDIAGGTDVIGEPGARSREAGWDELAERRPDVVIAMPCGYYLDQAAAQVARYREEIDSLGASRVHPVDAAASFSRPGPRLVDGVEQLAELLHPDAFRR